MDIVAKDAPCPDGYSLFNDTKEKNEYINGLLLKRKTQIDSWMNSYCTGDLENQSNAGNSQHTQKPFLKKTRDGKMSSLPLGANFSEDAHFCRQEVLEERAHLEHERLQRRIALEQRKSQKEMELEEKRLEKQLNSERRLKAIQSKQRKLDLLGEQKKEEQKRLDSIIKMMYNKTSEFYSHALCKDRGSSLKKVYSKVFVDMRDAPKIDPTLLAPLIRPAMGCGQNLVSPVSPFIEMSSLTSVHDKRGKLQMSESQAAFEDRLFEHCNLAQESAERKAVIRSFFSGQQGRCPGQVLQCHEFL